MKMDILLLLPTLHTVFLVTYLFVKVDMKFKYILYYFLTVISNSNLDMFFKILKKC